MSRKTRKAMSIGVDIALGLVLVCLMSTALVEDIAHEWLGVSAFALVIAHLAINRRFFSSLFQGAYGALRIVMTAVDASIIVCIMCLAASSLVLSRHVFGWLPEFPGAAWARPMHMLASYWGFILVFMHAGLHIRFPKGIRPCLQKIIFIATCVILAGAGFVSLLYLDMPSCLFVRTQFVYADPSFPIFGHILLYGMVALGSSALGALSRSIFSHLMVMPSNGAADDSDQ